MCQFKETNRRRDEQLSERSSIVVSWVDYCNAVLVVVFGIYLQQLKAIFNAAERLICVSGSMIEFQLEYRMF